MSFSFAEGTALTDIVKQINNMSSSTGVTAEIGKNNAGQIDGIRLTSQDYGSKQTVQVQQRTGDLFANTGETIQSNGQDARVLVNGSEVVAEGLKVNFEVRGIRGSFTLSEAAAQSGYDQTKPTDASRGNALVYGISGGSTVQLGNGAGVQYRDLLGLPDYNLANLGKVTVEGQTYSMQDLASGRSASLAENPQISLKIIDQAIRDVATGQAAIGAYQANTLQSNINSLQNQYSNLISTESFIGDTNYATSITDLFSANLRSKIGVRMLQSNNINSQNVMQLLLGGIR